MSQRRGMKMLELLLVKVVLLAVFLIVRGGYRTATADVLESGMSQIHAVSATVEMEPAVTAGALRSMQPTRAAIFLRRQKEIQARVDWSSIVTNKTSSPLAVMR